MAFYEVTLRQRYFDQLCINVFPYYVAQTVGQSPNALELLTELGFIPTGDPLAFPADTLAAALAVVQSDNVQYLSVEARELYSLTDFYEAAYSPPLTGLNTGGDSASPFVAYGVYSNRVRTDIKRGFKRFVGVMEADMLAGGVLTSGSLGELTDLAEKMSEVVLGTSAAYSPAVFSFLKEEVPDSDPVRYRYVKYPDPADQAEHTAFDLTYAPYTVVRSQTSRQYGKGQ